MCWLRGWRFSRLHLWDELVRIYLPFHSLTALLSLMAEVRTITQTIGKVLRLMILCVNYFSPLRRLRDKEMEELLSLRWDLEGPVSSEEEWRCFPQGLRVWSSWCWKSCKWLCFRSFRGTRALGSWQSTCSRRNFWLKSVGEYWGSLNEKTWNIINPLIRFIQWLLPPSTGGFYAGFPTEIRKLDIEYNTSLFCIWFELLNGF